MTTQYRHFFDSSKFNSSACVTGPIDPESQQTIANYIQQRSTSARVITEICCGGAWLGIRLSNLLSPARLNLLDYSSNQLSIAKRNTKSFLSSEIKPNVQYIRSSATSIPIEDCTSELNVMSFAIHLIDRSKQKFVFEEAHRVCTSGGSFVIVTIDKNDIGNSLCDRYVEGYQEIDKNRFPTTREIISHGDRKLWSNIETDILDVTITYGRIQEASELLMSKPFSTFHALENKVGKKELNRRITTGIATMKDDFGESIVTASTRASIITLSKQ